MYLTVCNENGEPTNLKIRARRLHPIYKCQEKTPPPTRIESIGSVNRDWTEVTVNGRKAYKITRVKGRKYTWKIESHTDTSTMQLTVSFYDCHITQNLTVIPTIPTIRNRRTLYATRHGAQNGCLEWVIPTDRTHLNLALKSCNYSNCIYIAKNGVIQLPPMAQITRTPERYKYTSDLKFSVEWHRSRDFPELDSLWLLTIAFASVWDQRPFADRVKAYIPHKIKWAMECEGECISPYMGLKGWKRRKRCSIRFYKDGDDTNMFQYQG